MKLLKTCLLGISTDLFTFTSLCHKTTQQLSPINTLVTWKKRSHDQRSGPYQKKRNSFRIIFMSDFLIRFVANSVWFEYCTETTFARKKST